MKAVFTSNDQSESTYPLLRTAINSLKNNTTLTPIVVWSGSNNAMTDWLVQKGVEIVNHELSFKDQIKHFSFDTVQCPNDMLLGMYKQYSEYYNSNFIEAESLRMDLPSLFPDEKYILYSDCDVVFLKDPVIPDFDEPIAAVRRGTGFFNNGVMVFNIPALLEEDKAFKSYYTSSGYSFPIGDTTTQGAYNSYFKDKTFNLPIGMNWHATWGIPNNVTILHFCGPKPKDYVEMLKQVSDPMKHPKTYDPMYFHYFKNVNFYGQVGTLCDIWNKYAEKDDKIDTHVINT